MDTLPVDVVKYVAQYLTAGDVAACCAASHSWRDLFGQDIIWKRYCSSEKAEYLATAEGRQEPMFVSPENTDVGNSLNPIEKYRLSYMRQNLLLSHWKHGNMVTETLTLRDHPHDEDISLPCEYGLCYFISNDFFITSCYEEIMLWDVRRSPVYVSNPCNLLLPGGVDFYSKFDNNKIVIVQENLVQIYDCGSPVKPVWTLEQRFMFNRAVPMQLNETEGLETFTHTFFCFVNENYFVGILNSGEIHIWDLKIGTKLKQVPNPGNDEIISVATSKKLSQDFVIIFFRNNVYYLYVFCLATLEYYPFNTSSLIPFCAIQNGLLAICLGDMFHIYQYRTSQLVLIVHVDYTVGVLTLDDYFLLVATNSVRAFNTLTSALDSVLLELLDPNETIWSISDIVDDKFVMTTHYNWNLVGWEIDLKSTPMRMTVVENLANMFFFNYDINKVCTKVVENYRSELHVHSLW